MPTKSKAKPSSVKTLHTAVNKQFGAGTIGFASDPSLQIERIPSGILGLDYIMNGGFPRGRYAELYGEYSSGKTLVALLLIAYAQSLGLSCAFIDVEKTFDPVHAKHQNVLLDKLGFPLRKRRPGEEVIDIVEAHLYSGEYDLIVIDSIAALLPEAEQGASISKASMGTQQARLMSKALRKLTAANQNTVVVFINQLRDSLSMFVPEPVTSGGRAMGFYAGSRLRFQKVESIKSKRQVFDARKMKQVEKEVVTGHRTLITLTKDKTGGQPYDETTFVYDYDTGHIDEVEQMVYLGRRMGLIKARVSGKSETLWLASNPQKKYPGRSGLKRVLVRDEELREVLLDQICEA